MSGRWLAAAVLAMVLAAPVGAQAGGGWGWPVDGAVALRYGAAYTSAEGRTCTHGGLDIDAPAGTTVRACSSGEVAFAGLVPGGAGDRVWAVTVLTADGLRVSYLPLASTRVSKGAHVSEGDGIGALAGAGDGSSPGSHIHIGVKRGSASLDPLALFGQRTSAAASGGGSGGTVSTGSRATTVRSHAAVRTAPSSVTAPAGSLATAGSGSVARSAGSVTLGAATLSSAIQRLTDVPPLMRIEPLAAPAALNPGRARDDVMRMRGAIAAFALQVALFLIAGACVWSVMKSARAARLEALPALAHKGRD